MLGTFQACQLNLLFNEVKTAKCQGLILTSSLFFFFFSFFWLVIVRKDVYGKCKSVDAKEIDPPKFLGVPISL